MFLGAAPPASAIEEWVLGLARPAYVYLSDGPLPRDDGEVHGSVREPPLCFRARVGQGGLTERGGRLDLSAFWSVAGTRA